MRALWIAAAVLTAGGMAAAADITASIAAEGPLCPFAAKRIASGLFGRAGITLEWVKPRPGQAACVHIQLTEHTPAEHDPNAMAYAHPYGGCGQRIIVFMDRIRARAAGDSHRESALLAYVLVHEITHVIQRVSRHSDSGIMKAHWTAADYEEIFARRMPFQDQDVRLMERALAVGLMRRPPVLIGQSGTQTAVHPE